MKPVLAPMVRAGFVGMQRICSVYGADTLFTDALFPQNIINSNIFESQDILLFIRKDIRTIFFDKSLLHKTCVQLVGSDFDTLSQSILILQKYFTRIDLNCGCTKNFARQGGYGADLLNRPESLISLLKQLTQTHPKIDFSVKIRYLESEEKTIQFVSDLFNTGVKYVSIHMRHINQDRETSEADFNQFYRIYEQSAFKKQLIANGGIISLKDYEKFKKLFVEPPQVMIASGAVRNPSVFKAICGNIDGISEQEVHIQQVLQELMSLHVLKPQSYKQIQGDAFELSPESIAQFYFVDTKIGIAMIIQYTKKYKLDKQDVEWAKLAAPKINNAKNMNDIIQIINE
ncbi:tRNA-dihydrouridine_synthase [Hexamita inflata]|uniref:tRNA-dihydrouridine synthase n=1 Tax=Hexamita inflata TaxID=28002 RepID=A0AA86PA74_9EUKA|nr:tRNA-dihydrouridine synthase [Hexamita inflata]